MEETKSVIKGEFDRSGQYDSGLKSLVKSLQWAFAFLLVVIIGLMVYFVTAGGYFSVEPQNAVIVLQFGKIENTYTSDGHWFLPYPVNRWVKVRTNQQSLRVDFLPAETPDGAPPQALVPGKDSYLITGDANIIHSTWRVTYHVANPAKYYESLATPFDPTSPDTPEKDINGFVGTRGPQTLLRNLFRAAVIEVTSGKTVDSMLYSGRAAYSDAVRNEFARQLAAIDCGVEVDNVTLEQVFPPLKTKSAFDEVAAASNTVDSLRSKAEQYAVQAGNEALAMQTELISSATTYKEMVVSEVKAESIYFQKIYEQYRNDPETVLMTLYTSTLADVLQKQQGKYILGSSGTGSKQVRLLLNHEQKKQQTPAGDAAEEK